MDVTKYLEPRIAPRAVFDALAERADRPRFQLRQPDGSWRAVTYGAFAEQIRDVGGFLAAAGLGAGDRAAVYAGNSVAWASSALAIQAAGGVMVPVYPACTAEQAAYVLGHCDAKVVFVDGPALLSRVLESWAALPALEKVVTLTDDVDPARVAAKLREASPARPTPRSPSAWSRSRRRAPSAPRATPRTRRPSSAA